MLEQTANNWGVSPHFGIYLPKDKMKNIFKRHIINIPVAPTLHVLLKVKSGAEKGSGAAKPLVTL